MKWLLLVLSHVVAQTFLPLLPTGVTMSMVKQIQVNTGGVVEFVKSTDDSATYSHRLPYTPIIKFDTATGTLTVDSAIASASSILKPGLMVAFLATIFGALHSHKQHGALLIILSMGLGVVSAGLVTADVTIRVPGCFHTEGVNNNLLVFDDVCAGVTVSAFVAPAEPVYSASPKYEWEPLTPATDFLPFHDKATHEIAPEDQYEVWRNNFGRKADPTEKQNFLAFTEHCRLHNLDPNREWTAACNQFAYLSHSDWMKQVLANNSETLAEANAPGRRLLSADMFTNLDENHQRKLLQSTSFSWIGKGKLTPVKDQGQCGSCYAHSTTSQMEAQLAIEKGTVPRVLSREQLKSCSVGFPGCNGGDPSKMYVYAQQTLGLGAEADYAYNPTNVACRSSVPAMAYKNAGPKNIAPNEMSFKAAVQIAPVAVSVCSSTWNNYAGGVFNCQNSASCDVDHAVLLVGYGTDATLGNYWLIQNSWRTSWGESGFIRLRRTDGSATNTGACGLTRYPGYQATTPSGTGGGTTSATDCQGSWGPYTQCSLTCGGGVMSRTWNTTKSPTTGGAPCPNPLTQSTSCNTQLCGGGTTSSCLHVENTVLGSTGEGDYTKGAGWQQNFGTSTNPIYCGTSPNPEYTMTKNGQTLALFFWTNNCYNSIKTVGQWGLGDTLYPRSAYQWSSQIKLANGVIPPPNLANWSLWFSACGTL